MYMSKLSYHCASTATMDLSMSVASFSPRHPREAWLLSLSSPLLLQTVACLRRMATALNASSERDWAEERESHGKDVSPLFCPPPPPPPPSGGRIEESPLPPSSLLIGAGPSRSKEKILPRRISVRISRQISRI